MGVMGERPCALLKFALRWVLALAGLAVLLAVTPASALEPVTVQLKWKHQFQFAGFYAAIEQGYYRDEGLEVKLVEADGARDPNLEVLEGRAQYGVGGPELVMLAAKGLPIVLVAAIFQHSPLVLLTRASADLHTVQELAGKRVAVEPQAADLVAYLQREGVPMSRIQQRPPAYTVEPLLNGEVDAMWSYRTDEPFAMQERGEAYVLLDPRVAGIDFYGDTLFTTQKELDKRPDRVASFRKATVQGWRWAMDHADETLQLILAKYPRRHSLAHLQYEAEQTRRLVLPDIIEIGYLNPGRVEHIAQVYAETGLIPAVPSDLATHIYDPHPTQDLLHFWLALGCVVGLLGAALAATWHYRRLVLRLQAAERKTQELVAQLRDLAQTDVLTGLCNRRAGEDRAEAEFARCVRYGRPMALLLLDIDHFKRVNDADGHLAGDQVLRMVARFLPQAARTSDTTARVGGEEFLVLLPETTVEGAKIVAERLREGVDSLQITTDAGLRKVTVSVGIAVLTSDLTALRELWHRADHAMYCAKNAGRNRVALWENGVEA